MADYLTFLDVASQTSDGKLVQIAKEFVSGLTFFKSAPWKEATHLDKDECVFATDGEHFSQTKFMETDGWFKPTKDTYYKRISHLGRIGASRTFELNTIKTVPNGNLFVQRGLDDMHRHMGNDAEYAILNTSQNTNPNAPEGLLPRYSKITNMYGEVLNSSGTTTGDKTPFVCLDALGGKGSDSASSGHLSSILIVYFSDVNGVSLVYPRGSKEIGIDFKFYDNPQMETSSDGMFRPSIYATTSLTYGISVNNALACTRIANVNPNDETSLKTAMNLVFDAYERMDGTMKQGAMIFTTAEVVCALRKLQYKNVYQTSLRGVQALNLKGDVVVDDDIFTVCHNMLHTEGRIKLNGES